MTYPCQSLQTAKKMSENAIAIPTYGSVLWVNLYLTPVISDLGREVPEAKERKDVRELIFQGYRIIYLRQPSFIYIVAVIHGSRDLSGMENKPWDIG